MKGCMKPISLKILKYMGHGELVEPCNRIQQFRIALLCFLFLILTFNSCSKNSQSVQMLDAAPVTCELYGTCTKSFSLAIDQLDYINWAALDWSGEYKYFEVTQITIGQKTYEGDGSTHIFEKLTLAKSNVVTVTYTYSPLTAQEDVNTPHHATLKLVGASPQLATIQVDLTGYVQGVCDSETEECKSVDTSLQQKKYVLANDSDKDGVGDFELYLCSTYMTEIGQDNIGDQYADTNLTYINIDEEFVFYVAANGSTVHLQRSDGQKITPSIPAFNLPVPDGNYDGFMLEGQVLSIEMVEGQDIESSIEDGTFIFEGDEGLELEVGGSLVGTTPLTVTNGSTNPESKACTSSFANGISGEGDFDSDEMSIVAWGYIDESNYVTSIIDALVVAVITLEPTD